MADKKQESGFTVTDRRWSTEDGELRKDTREEVEPRKAATPPAPVPTSGQTAAQETTPADNSAATFPAEGSDAVGESMPPAPTAAEQQAQADAYRESRKNWTRAWGPAAAPAKSLR